MDNQQLLLRVNDVTRVANLSRSGIYKLLSEDEKFPKPVRLKGSKTLYWRTVDLHRWVNSLQTQKQAGCEGDKNDCE